MKNWPTSKTPIVCYKNLGHISYTDRVIANFVFKYPHFCYHGIRGPSETSYNVVVKLADPETPFRYQNMGIISFGNRVIASTAVRGPQYDLW